MTRFVTVVDVGSKQDFIFATNKQVLSVGASHLVKESTTAWALDEAAAIGLPIERVHAMSGRVVALVDTPQQGRELVRRLTEKALDRAPGLELWGVTHPQQAAAAEVGARLRETFALLDQARSRRPAAAASGQSVPFVEQCAYTGAPAVGLPRDSADVRARSAGVQAMWAAGRAGREALARSVGATAGTVVDVHGAGADGLGGNGWAAVISGDANGLGAVFAALGQRGSETFWPDYRALSAAVEKATFSAIRRTVSEVEGGAAERGVSGAWLLPLVVGGDDVCVAVDARVAWLFATTFATAMEEAAAAEPLLTDALRGHGHERLTVGLGVAFTKPKHPFFHAVRLSRELERNAKRIKDCGHSSLDLVVHYEGSLRGLQSMRRGRPAAPTVVLGDSDANGRGVREHDFSDLCRRLAGPEVSNVLAHRLRGGGSDAARARERLAVRGDLPANARAELDEVSAVSDGALAQAMALVDVTGGWI